MAKNKERDQSFEASLASLEQIVARLESGELSLERALELFEEGVGLARRCQSQLEDAERKVEMLLRERGEIRIVPYDAGPFDAAKDSLSNNAETPQALSAANSTSNAPWTQSEKANLDESESDDSVPF
jgi:exodeoxyribonuclease VII small subunit